jgi:addiction module HigA family antidote
MPKARSLTPIAALTTLIAQYDTNPTRIAKEIKVSQTSIRNIVAGDVKISAKMALRLAKYFGTTPDYWLNLQASAGIAAAAKDKELSSILKAIKKVKKPAPAAKAKATKTTGPRKAGRKPKKAAAGKKTASTSAAKAGRKPRPKKN